MHPGSFECMRKFVNKYLNPNKNLNITDIGSYDVNGTYKNLFKNPNWKYTELDIEKGPNVDIIAKSPTNTELKNNSYDIVISGNVLEHVESPWIWIKELKRICKKGGLICIIVPFSTGEHRFPLDCWKILPEGMNYLLKKHCKLNILESKFHKHYPRIKPTPLWKAVLFQHRIPFRFKKLKWKITPSLTIDT